MNRTDRLYALVEELRAAAPGFRTASQLADRFEVTTRTIERDLLALQEAGVPIWAQSGRRGGYAIDAARTLPPVNFTAAEAAAVAVALAQPGATPLPGAARLALQKLVAAMSGPDAEAARSLARRVRNVGRPPEAPAIVPTALEDAVVAGKVIRLDYEDKDGGLTSREVEPMGLVGVDGWWYVVGHCRLRAGTRVFRVDRVRAVRVLDEHVGEHPVPDPPELEGMVLRPNLLE